MIRHIRVPGNSVKLVLFVFFAILPNNARAFEKEMEEGCAENAKLIIERTKRKPEFKNALWSVSVKKAHNGSDVLSFDSKYPLICASIMKVLTTWAAMDVLGPGHQFETGLYMDGKIEKGVLDGNLYIKGGGDPSFGSHILKGATPLEKVFLPWIEELKKRGVKVVNGFIYSDDTLFSGIEISPTWAWEDIGNYYAAWPSALSINDNLYRLCFKPSSRVGGSARLLGMEPRIYEMKFINLMKTGPENSGDNGYIFNMPKNYRAILRGTLPKGHKKFCIKGALPDPGLFAGQYFLRQMKKSGIKVRGWVSGLDEKIDYSGKTEIARALSPPLKDIVKVTNTKSFNLYAEILLRHLSVAGGGNGSLVDGIKKLKSFLTMKDLDVKSSNFEDGSGLSRLNKAPAELFSNALVKVYKSEYFYDFYDSLVSPGEKGAKGHIKYFGKGTLLEKNLKIKSGSLKKVRAYCGYLRTKSERILSFAFIMNNYSANPKSVDKIHEKILLNLYKEY